MKRKIYSSLFALLILAIAGYFLFHVLKNPPINPVIVIGLDGADWNIINPLLARGKLPHLGRLIKEGSSGVLETVRPTKSPVIWTSIATGKTMLKHGVLDWVYVKENNIEIPYSVEDRNVKPAWKILSEGGFSVGVVNWFCTFPAQEVNGFLVSDRFRVSVDKYLEEDVVTYPAELKDSIFPKVVQFKDQKFKQIIREEGIVSFLQKSKNQNLDLPPIKERQVRQFRRYFLQDKSIENIALFLLENVTVDFFAAYFRLIDTTSHFASVFLESELREKWIEDNERYGGPTPETEKLLFQNMATIMESVYIYMDNVVGRIVSRARENTTFIIVSDHGFNFSTQGYNHYNVPIIPHGIVIIKGPGIRPGKNLDKAHIFDIAPTILYLFASPVGKDMDGQVIIDAFQDDFKKRRKVQYISTYEDDSASPKKKRRKALDKEVLEDLRSLGYIR